MLLKDDQKYHIHLGDCITHMSNKEGGGMPDQSVDFAVFSPPFSGALCIHVRGSRHRQQRGFGQRNEAAPEFLLPPACPRREAGSGRLRSRHANPTHEAIGRAGLV